MPLVKDGNDWVLLNPAVHAADSLAQVIGPQQNIYTGERYEFTAQHVAELRALNVERITPERYLLVVSTGDELLDYRAAVSKFAGARQIVIQGSDHGMSDFASYAEAVVAFCGGALKFTLRTP